MLIAAELINDNGISSIALGFFSALFTMIATIVVALIKTNRNTEEIKGQASIAADKADAAAKNTKNVSNGFAGQVNEKLDRLEELMTDHLKWHLHNEKDK